MLRLFLNHMEIFEDEVYVALDLGNVYYVFNICCIYSFTKDYGTSSGARKVVAFVIKMQAHNKGEQKQNLRRTRRIESGSRELCIDVMKIGNRV